MPLLSFERANQWVPLDFMLKTDKMKLPLHEFSFVKATAPCIKNANGGILKKIKLGIDRNRKIAYY